MTSKSFFKQLILIGLTGFLTSNLCFGQVSACGDTDGNLNIDIVDALRIAQCVTSIMSCSSIPNSDVNCDGSTNIVDALLIAQYSVGILTSLNCCNILPTPTPTIQPNFTLQCYLEFNPDIYPTSRHYPQYSLWVKDKVTGKIYSIFITRFAAGLSDSASNNRPYALPVWFGVRKNEKTQNPYPAIDTISGATPLIANTTISWPVPKELVNNDFEFYLEGNISLDYNNYYTQAATEYNGQPSLIWMSAMKTQNSPITLQPSIIGNGAILGTDSVIHTDGLSNITTARNIFKSVIFRL